jgi:Protein of unknown function (DUF3592)
MSSKIPSQAPREVRGTITKSAVIFDGENYRPIVKYQYEIDGCFYSGDGIFRGPLIQFNWRGPARRLTARFPVGASVAVYVDPADSTACRARIPRDVGPVFHGIPGHGSTASRAG